MKGEVQLSTPLGILLALGPAELSQDSRFYGFIPAFFYIFRRQWNRVVVVIEIVEGGGEGGYSSV